MSGNNLTHDQIEIIGKIASMKITSELGTIGETPLGLGVAAAKVAASASMISQMRSGGATFEQIIKAIINGKTEDK